MTEFFTNLIELIIDYYVRSLSTFFFFSRHV